ncbi:SPFH domain-containing protein [Spongiactinospora sp. TRM90649]|uniref:SPFH domain-containing protein n=1 Tax=Spongiactinospora sp. TRM90649 TaxID=3031114 RepID=UPI0023F6C788|nr:SPFH domain-containing protein [Spongiactinospora sp. TRM90649]MDF5752098.1 SPFH domain-containing protein [Spongiactinospora sp. TRM90649]
MSLGSSFKIAAGVAALLLAIPTLIGLLGGLERTEPGQIAVVRDGGPFDDTAVRQIIDPGSGITWAGMWSSVHAYPAQQRFYTITSDPKRATALGVDVVTTPSADGVNLGIEGTLYFTLNLDHETLRRFDDRFGTRTFRGQDDTARYAWDGDEGWAAFFGQAVRPVIDNALRVQVGARRCVELVSSCALVQEGGGTDTEFRDTVANVVKVQEGVNAALARDVPAMLGDDFITGIRFNLVKVTLPTGVQDAVNRSLAAAASVSESRAKVLQAEAEAKANQARQDGYDKCPACAEIDKLKSLPSGITVYAPGNADAVVVPTR